ncbi:unnamed protein product [Closterium sp. NIES-54]
MIIFATFIRENRVVTKFLALLTVEKCDAASLLYVFVSHLQAIGIELAKIAGMSTDGASVMMGSKNGLVARLRLRIPHLVSSHYIAHRYALAAKDAADAIPEFDMVDGLIRQVAEYLGRSSPWHQRFLELQELFTATNLELQGIHQVRWLSRGDAILRTVAVFPALIVMLSEWDETRYQLATSYRRFEDLDNLVGVRLFMPDEYPPGRAERHKQCVEWLMSLLSLFRAQETDHILPGTRILCTLAVHDSLCSYVSTVPCIHGFHAGLKAMLKTSDWTTSYPNLVRLLVAVAVLPLSTVECERGFSRLNIIKSWQRGSLKDAWLEDLVMMSLLDYEPDNNELVKIWHIYKKRRPFGNVAAPPAREGEGSGTGKEALEEWEEPKAQGSDDESDSDADTWMTHIR